MSSTTLKLKPGKDQASRHYMRAPDHSQLPTKYIYHLFKSNYKWSQARLSQRLLGVELLWVLTQQKAHLQIIYLTEERNEESHSRY